MTRPRLARDRFARARDFVLARARPLDRARFRHHFEGGAAADVLAALAAFQNADGGFGNALEPDFRLPASSPMATSVAFHVLREIGAGDGEELVRDAVRYLVDAWDPERPGWQSVPPEIDDHPRAPWWDFQANAAPRPASWGNPNADLAAALHEHASLVPARLLAELTATALERLDAAPSPIDPYAALCYLRLERVAPPPARARIAERLRRDARTLIDLDPARREANHFQPFWLAERPDDLLADPLREEIERNLDAEIARQHPDGYWEPRWTWADRHPDVWERARAEWRGSETLRTVAALAAWGRMHGR